MNSRSKINILLVFTLFFFGLSGFGSIPLPKRGSKITFKNNLRSSNSRPVHTVPNYGHFPLAFEPNQGQANAQVQYLVHGRGYSLFVTGQEAVLVLKKPSAAPPSGFPQKSAKGFSRAPLSPKISNPTALTVIRMKLEGAQPGTFEGQEKLAGVSNYFVGKDRSKWHTRIPQFGKIRASEVYPGVDLDYYGNQGKLEYDFVLKPGTDPKSVRISFEGAKSSQVNAEGDLELETSQGTLIFRAPSLYQESDGSKTTVEGHYHLDANGKIGFGVKNYDPSKPLIIDPVLDYSTFLGGSGFDWGTGIALDSSGNAYVIGGTSSLDFPVTSIPYQSSNTSTVGSSNVFVSEINSTGTTMVFSTYLGGSGEIITQNGNPTPIGDEGAGITLDSSGNIYLTGFTGSSDFPIQNPLASSFFNSTVDAFVTELSPGGSNLVFSTYLGGSGNSSAGYGDYGNGIALDGSGNVYVTGYTTSIDFPVQNPYQGPTGIASGAFANAFVAKINPSPPALIYSTYLGGSYYDQANGIAVDTNGNMFVTGYTYSPNFPVTNALQSSFGGSGGFTLNTTINAFVTEINSIGSSLIYSTYLGGSNKDGGFGIALDGSDDAYVTGWSTSPTFPTQNAYQATPNNPYDNVFVCEILPGGGNFVYSTFLSGSNAAYFGDYGYAIAVDNQGYAYVTGSTGSSDFPVTNAIQNNILNYSTAFITQLEPGGTGLVYSTYLGGSGFNQNTGYGESGNAIAVDNNGNAYITGYTYSADFPTTVTPPQPVIGGGVATTADDAFIAEISEPLPPTATPTDTPSVTATYTASGTSTSTPTITNTPTPTSTPTITPTDTTTSTPTVTFTPSFTPTSTSTPTVTFTPTVTPTPTWTPSFTFTATWTYTPTGTSTSTITFTPTPSYTPTPTTTPTSSPTAIVSAVQIGAPYPNPVSGKGPVWIPVQAPTNSTAHLTIYTLAFRKIYDKTISIPANNYTFAWPLEDSWGHQAANGLYYVRIQVIGPVNAQDIKKILVLR